MFEYYGVYLLKTEVSNVKYIEVETMLQNLKKQKQNL